MKLEYETPDHFLGDTEAPKVILQAAKAVHRRCVEEKPLAMMNVEDLAQEAYLLIIRQMDLLDALEDKDYGLFQHRLEMDLFDLVRTERSRNDRFIDLPALSGDMEVESGEGEGNVPIHRSLDVTPDQDYDRDTVEQLLPAIWRETYAYGLDPAETTPPADMPRGSVNKATSNNLPAYIADIKTAWQRARLTHKERCALLLVYGLGWEQKDAAFNQGINKQGMSARVRRAITKVVDQLNEGDNTINWRGNK